MTTRMVCEICDWSDWADSNIEPVARFVYDVTNFPGNKDIAISHSLKRIKGSKGHGKKAFKQRMSTLKNMGYEYVMFTVRGDNKAQIAIMQHFCAGYEDLHVTELDRFMSGDVEILIYGVKL